MTPLPFPGGNAFRVKPVLTTGFGSGPSGTPALRAAKPSIRPRQARAGASGAAALTGGRKATGERNAER